MKKIIPAVFWGSSSFSVYVLKEFLKRYKFLLVITLKGKPQGRGLKIIPNLVYSYCLKEKLNVIEFEDWQKIKEYLKKLQPLVGIIAGFGKIIPKEIIDFFPKGILNVHPSLLPKYRGPNPIKEAILQGDKETGVTIFLIDELVDHGPIIIQKPIPLTGKENFIELEEKLGKLGGKLLSQIIEIYLNDNITLIPQDETKATYTKKLSKEDGILDLNETYEIWDRKIRALNPWPGTFIYLKGKILKIFSIEKIDIQKLTPEISKIKIGNFFTLKNDLGLRLNDAFIILKEVQLEGRKKMSGREFLNGFRKLIFDEKS